jgi:hypothetical protein
VHPEIEDPDLQEPAVALRPDRRPGRPGQVLVGQAGQVSPALCEDLGDAGRERLVVEPGSLLLIGRNPVQRRQVVGAVRQPAGHDPLHHPEVLDDAAHVPVGAQRLSMPLLRVHPRCQRLDGVVALLE